MKQTRFYRILFFLVMISIFGVMLIFFFFRNPSFLGNLSSPVSGIISKVDNILSTPFRFALSVGDDVKELLDTYKENEELKSEISDLENQQEELQRVMDENEALKAEISTSDSFTNPVNLIAQVIVRSPVSWYDSLVVGVGSSYGVKSGMLVTSNGGLIGKISSVSSQSSNVELLSSSEKINIPVKISTGNSFIYGLLTSFDKSTSQYVVSQVNSSEKIEANSQVLTSGLDGESVSDVIVGNVSKVDDASDTLNRKIYVTPKVNFDAVRYVTIVGD
ncbi:rod shape-determining protein MreC [Streptococcus orisratti]|uniref:rod shape-determining protein MreC n=1 Tax=Streptococcus orisratti TaxID=114652 RepID=UPI003D06A84E